MRSLLLASLPLLVLPTPQPAHACSFPENVWQRSTTPEDGAIDVPTNARLQVDYHSGWGGVGGTLSLRAADGSEVPTRQERMVLLLRAVVQMIPIEPLLPDTKYELLDTVVVDGTCDIDCDGPPRVIATFTTGDGPDLTAPALLDVGVVSEYHPPDESDSCGSGSAIAHQPTVGTYVDDHQTGWVRLNYYDADGALIAGPLPIVRMGHACGSDDYGLAYSLSHADDVFEVRAVDLAGNVEPTGHRLEGASCPEATGGEADGGCRAGGAGGGPGAAALALLGILVWRRRRDPRIGPR